MTDIDHEVIEKIALLFIKRYVDAPDDVPRYQPERPDVILLAQAYLDLLDRTRWIPVGEGLPKPGDSAMLVTNGKDFFIEQPYLVVFTNNNVCRRSTCFGEDITHWQPLPPPPEQDKEPNR